MVRFEGEGKGSGSKVEISNHFKIRNWWHIEWSWSGKPKENLSSGKITTWTRLLHWNKGTITMSATYETFAWPRPLQPLPTAVVPDSPESLYSCLFLTKTFVNLRRSWRFSLGSPHWILSLWFQPHFAHNEIEIQVG